MSKPARPLAAAAALLTLSLLVASGDEPASVKVGVQPDGRVVVPTNQVLKPAGRQVTFPGRPVDLLLLDGGKVLAVLSNHGLVFLDADSGRVLQKLASPAGLSVVGLAAENDRLYASDAGDRVRVARRGPDGGWAWAEPFRLAAPKVGGAAHPAGLALHDDELWAASTRGNCVQRLDRATGRVKEVIPVGVAPFAVLFARPDRCYVSNWGGDPPEKGRPEAPSSKSPVRIDPRTGVADDGTVSVLGPAADGWQQLKTIKVGLHPSGLAASRTGKFVYVANACSDTVSVLDTASDTVVQTIACRPGHRLPFGSGCNALAVSPDGGTLYVANGSNNCIAVVRLAAGSSEGDPAGRPRASAVLGLIPTAWYPGAVRLSADGRRLFVANVKGLGSLSRPRPAAKGMNSRDYLGSVSLIDVPGAARLAEYTARVNAGNRLALALAGLLPPRPDVKPVPVPERHGEPSLFEHVVYVIKENRTYDQVFGDLKEGDGDPKLVMFGEEVTPNLHALARQFTLLDNFYCSGVLSADGHSWVNQAYVTDYLERAFGGFTRSYPFEGSDPLAFAPTGFLWDAALARGKSFRNYGEFVRTTFVPAAATWADLFADWKQGARTVKVHASPNLHTLRPWTHPGYPGFNLNVPDVYRARLFLEGLKEYERKGAFPNLVYLYLPCDHTAGTRPGAPKPAAMVADNDLAVGQVVEGLSRSRFWPKTCIFVVEDDPQAGFDHVDGHRSVALVISPYTRRRFVDHTNYTQTGMVKTIELILGLPPLNQLDLAARPMRGCFQAAADPTPYTCVPSRVPLDRMNPPLKKLKGAARRWAEKSLALDLDDADRADEDTFNRILWHATRGEEPYPAAFVGRRSAPRQAAEGD